MSDQIPEDRWLALLADALQDQPTVPRHVVEAAYAAYTWGDPDAELAKLTYDSDQEELAAAGTRSQQASLRSLTYTGPTVSIELMVEHGAVLGQLVPAQQGTLVVAYHDGSTSTLPVDGLGCFALSPAPAAPFQLRLTGEVVVVTDWIRLHEDGGR
jgi:hypothetical protein